jgi:hypothetical protein
MTTTRSGLAAVLALVLTSAALALPASAASKPSFTSIAQYAERHHVCVGKVTKLTGNKVTKGAKKYNIIGSLSCATKSVLTIVDYFSSTSARAKVTSSKGFPTQAVCTSNSFQCAVTFDKNWLFIALVGTKDKKVLAADEVTVRKDYGLMSPSLINALR